MARSPHRWYEIQVAGGGRGGALASALLSSALRQLAPIKVSGEIADFDLLFRAHH